MMITNKFKLDLQKPGTIPTIHAVQNDSYSRNLEIALYADKQPFVFPDNGSVVIRYKKSDGRGGEYDTLPDGTVAWWTKQNVLTVALAPQVLTTPGSVLLSVTLIADGTQLSVFPIRISVEPIAAAKLAKSEDYFYITGLLPAPVSGKVGQYLRIATVNDKGRITSVEAAGGVTPQKGVDYWTDSDQESIVQDVLAALGTPVFGTVDDEKNIILSGTLADGTYTLKYEYANGNVITIGTLEHGITQNYTNQIPISTDTDGSIYNGTGYAVGKRISSSYTIKDVTNLNAPNLLFVTGFIPVKTGDIIRMKNCFMDITGKNSGQNTYGQTEAEIAQGFYNSDKAPLARATWYQMKTDNNWIAHMLNSEGYATEFTITGENVAYVRFNLAPTGNAAEAIITVNEVID